MSAQLSNPLLRATDVPLFDEFKPEHIAPAVEHLITTTEASLKALEEDGGTSFQDVYLPLDAIDARIEQVWMPVVNMQSVMNTAPLRKAYEQVLPRYVAMSLRIKQSKPIYAKLQALLEDGSLTEQQRHVVNLRVNDAKMAGIELEGEQHKRFNAITAELSQLASQFSNNCIDARKSFQMVLTLPAETAGLTVDYLRFAAQKHRDELKSDAHAETGPWLVGLDEPSCLPFMQYSECRELRAKLYRAMITAASAAPYDNRDHIRTTLRLRRELASLLGFSTFADMRLADHMMAAKPDNVLLLQQRLRAATHAQVQAEHAELTEFARAHGQSEPVGHHDMFYWVRRMSEERFSISDNELRRYLPLPKVLEGMFSLCEELFAIKIEACQAQVWHTDVKFYRVYDQDHKHLASFYLDPYSRSGLKNSGAWVTYYRSRNPDTKPVTQVTCNFSSPVEGMPSLLNFRDVLTLFHEFGHAVHHMLTVADYNYNSGASGVEWDVVELPSQFMENFCYQPDVLKSISCHVETETAMPDDIIKRLQKHKQFRAASHIARQLYFGTTDLRLHTDFDSDRDDPFALMQRVASETLALQPLPEDRFLCSFGHIFAGGYAAGYYSYAWAEVLSCDAFALFAEGNDQQAGLRYLNMLLSRLGCKDTAELYRQYRGRDYDIGAFLASYGL
ncbi:MAG: M3 family metallopeptidase [Pseudomonadota bacterium]|nr:M3 family metallopeptidase [Pseudomonadota bacterium]